MNIEELVASLKQKGLQDEQIKAELEKIKEDIDKFLNPQTGTPAPSVEDKKDAMPLETDDDKEKRVFGF